VTALDDAFGLPDHAYIFLIGGGGKTTLMFTLAHHLAGTGRTVVSTTSTKIMVPASSRAARVIIEADPARAVVRLRAELPAAMHITLGKTLYETDRKLGGFAADELDYIRQAQVADCLLVEADGSAGRSLKAHNDYEPVISPHADLVIAVIGSDCLGCPLSDAHVHRAARFSQLLNRPLDLPVTADDVAAIVFHPLGYLKSVPSGAEVIVLLTKAGDPAQRANAARLAAALRAADTNQRIKRIMLGELPSVEPAG
jgi:probable selenium-dependent hydroxylase accessory protein YqeC